MELSRRDVLAALAASGAAVGAGAMILTDTADAPIGDHDAATLVAVAEVVYPSEVEGVGTFVREYSVNRVRERPDYADGVADAVESLDDYSREWNDGDDFADLAVDRRDWTLSGFGVDAADPDPDGSDRERIRYYLVNELLYALFTTPTGGELAGVENPQGFPGGTDSYQRGPR